ncbi:MAG TPA: hypothetical protein VGM10_12040 [Actinocrinis sp.]|jgi:ABC-type nitrate/sulfonate/bicarbonate transport system substrate-binding protein
MAVRRVRLGVFSPSVLLEVAARTGAFAQAGLSVEEVPVGSSPKQFARLLSGELDAAFTSPDNVFAYRDAATNPLGVPVDVRILAAVDRGLGLSLFAEAGAEAADLSGSVLGVDAAGTGFALVAYELLARQGLCRGRDYRVEAIGSTPMRADALIAGRCTMTVLNAGSDLRAEAAGCTRLGRVSSLGSYIGTVLAAPGDAVDAADANGSTTFSALTRAITQTSHRLADGELQAQAIDIAVERLGLDRAWAARYAATLADPAEGLVPDGSLDPAALDTLRRLRERHAGAAISGDRE